MEAKRDVENSYKWQMGTKAENIRSKVGVNRHKPKLIELRW